MTNPLVKPVVGVGVYKTGTTSLGVALQSFGYSVNGPWGLRQRREGWSHEQVCERAMRELLPRNDGFQDYPWFHLYPDIAEQFPDALFVLTTRDCERWWQSMLNHFGRRTVQHFTPAFPFKKAIGRNRKAAFIEAMERHNQEVRDYFTGTSRLIELDVSHDESIQQLAAFLGITIEPDARFPRENAASSRLESLPLHRRLRSVLRRELFRAMYG